jgi:hypothetical protein
MWRTEAQQSIDSSFQAYQCQIIADQLYIQSDDKPFYVMRLVSVPADQPIFRPAPNNQAGEEINWWCHAHLYSCRDCEGSVGTGEEDLQCECGNLSVVNGKLQHNRP